MPSSSRFSSPRARWIALVVVCCAQLMSIVDATIVNVALPSIQRSLHFSSAELTWVLNGYLISFGSLLLFAGRLGDLVGRRRIFLAGIALFTLASAACGLADTRPLLIAARFVQGVGGAGATSAIMAIITTEFRAPRERATAMSVYMFVVACGGSLGLLAGGVITQALSWHWIFFINVPVGVAVFALGRLWITENPGLGLGRDVDAVGPVLVTGAMMLGTSFLPLLTIAMGNVEAADAGMASGIVNTSLQLSGALGVAVLGTVSGERTVSLATAGASPTAALLGGYHLAFLVALSCSAAAIAASLALVRAPRSASAAAAAAEMPANRIRRPSRAAR